MFKNRIIALALTILLLSSSTFAIAETSEEYYKGGGGSSQQSVTLDGSNSDNSVSIKYPSTEVIDATLTVEGSSDSDGNFAEGVSGCALIAENIRMDEIPQNAAYFLGVEGKINGLRESKIRRWLVLDKDGEPIQEIIKNPWSKLLSEPRRTVLSEDEKAMIESARTQIHTALLNQERM